MELPGPPEREQAQLLVGRGPRRGLETESVVVRWAGAETFPMRGEWNHHEKGLCNPEAE